VRLDVVAIFWMDDGERLEGEELLDVVAGDLTDRAVGAPERPVEPDQTMPMAPRRTQRATAGRRRVAGVAAVCASATDAASTISMPASKNPARKSSRVSARCSGLLSTIRTRHRAPASSRTSAEGAGRVMDARRRSDSVPVGPRHGSNSKSKLSVVAACSRRQKALSGPVAHRPPRPTRAPRSARLALSSIRRNHVASQPLARSCPPPWPFNRRPSPKSSSRVGWVASGGVRGRPAETVRSRMKPRAGDRHCGDESTSPRPDGSRRAE
jgi:hypothetical protein